MNAARLRLLVAAKRSADARKLAESMLGHATRRNDTLALGVVADAAAGQADLAAVAVRAAEAMLAIDGETTSALLRATQAYAAAGNAAKVKEYGPKAVAAAEKAVAGDKDALGTLRVAAAHFAAGDKAKAKATAEKALGLVDATNIALRRRVEEEAKKYGAEPQGDGK